MHSSPGKKNPNYHHKGRPYLDGFKSIVAPNMAARVQAIEGDRAAIEFRGFPPKQRDALVKVLGDKIIVQESDWNCVLLATPNQKKKPFDDVRVRRALSLSIDRWGGSKYLSKIAIVKTVGGVAFPGHPLAATQAELEQIAGYGKDLAKNRAEAKRLLKEAGHENLTFVLNNRGVDQPYKVVGTWLVDQWKKVGLNVTQQVNPSPVFYDILRKKQDFDVSIDFNCQSVINPIADVTKMLPGGGANYSGSTDQRHQGHLREAGACRDRSRAADVDARIRKACSRRRGNAYHHAVVVQDQPAPLIREGLEDRTKSLSGTTTRPGLAGPINQPKRKYAGALCLAPLQKFYRLQFREARWQSYSDSCAIAPDPHLPARS